MKGLTKRQRDVADFIKEFIQTHHYSPSFREIMAHFDFSCVGSVSKHINALKRKGILHNEKNCSRSLAFQEPIQPSSPPKHELELPLIGTIRAGMPIELFTHSQSVAVPEVLVHNRESTYVLRAKGDSLEEDMIINGDLLIVEARQEALAGETVIALINNHDIMVKQYYPEGSYIRLVGYNPHHHPIILHEENVAVQAVLVGLMRAFIQ